jgi:hypothetical protein
MALVGIPEYRSPIEQSLRCACGLRYVVFIGGCAVDDLACAVARDRAEQMNARFVDARITPFMNCECGALLDFTAVDTADLVM